MIRNAIHSDIPGIRALMEAVPGFWQSGWSEATLAQAIRTADGLAFVWEDESQILGFVCAHDLGFRAYLSELVVDAGTRRQGIATGLLAAVEEALRGRGQQVLIADVWRDAVSFYRSRGWEPPDAILLRYRLTVGD